MYCTNPIRLIKNVDPIVYPNGLEVPCGKCLLCRQAKRREWAMRVLHESSMHKDNVFVTLTYKEDCLPPYYSLRKRDLQLFVKRLRKSISPKKIRYYACGEYGDKTQRPHYHLIIFGLGTSRCDKEVVMQNWPYADWEVDEIREKAFGIVEPASIDYVAQYINKKYSGDMEYEQYVALKREPVFKIASLGIGRDWMYENKEYIEQNCHITVNGVRHSIPRYYVDKLEIDRSKIYRMINNKEKDLVNSLCGFRITRARLRCEDVASYLDVEAIIRKSSVQRELNKKKCIELFKREL